MYHPTTRVLTILELLQAHPQLSGAELARRLEVDRRTVRRYIAMLGDLGIPIEAERGAHGGYRLRPGFKMPPLMLSDDEAVAMTLSLVAARSQGLPVPPHALAGGLAKLERTVPPPTRQRIQSVRSVVSFSHAAAAPRPREAVLLLVSAAAASSQRIAIRYQAEGAATERDVDPYGVVRHWDAWYLAGWCYLREAMRVFRIDRIQAARVLDAPFAPPPDFDPLAFVLESLAAIPAAWSAEIVFETSLQAIQDYFPPGAAALEAT
ncbi:MAG TPA: YafY family protein, partial [Herpetosiphonaceae bacterium]